MNGKSMLTLAFVAGPFYCMNAAAVDRGLYEQYQGYKQRQQRGQQEVLEQARAAARDWDFETAERQLATARNMAYAPDDLRAVEQLIADNPEQLRTRAVCYPQPYPGRGAAKI